MNSVMRRVVAVAVAGSVLALAGCERPPVQTVQRGYRGLAMVELYNPRIIAASAAQNTAPPPIGPPVVAGPPASSAYKNVQVLGDVSVAEFTRLMVAITTWVAPQQGCAYCHDTNDMASDALYPKVVARRMLQMTRDINSKWTTHVGETGVTCYTCHRGQIVPANLWFENPGPSHASRFAGNKAGQNTPAPQVGLTSLPFDPFTPFLENSNEIRVISTVALPGTDNKSIKQTEWTYALMMHFSQSLGVNCTYCHNTRSFAAWDASTPQRATAWYGIRMVRGLNDSYLNPLASTLPPIRHGPDGDGPKVSCATCHQGAFKPLYGAPMVKDYPELIGVSTAAAPAAAPAASTDAAVVTALLGKIYFDTGKTDIGPDGMKVVTAAVVIIKGHSGMVVAISGFADKTGNADQNLELAKQRAIAVRDALKGAGASDAQLDLKKPEFAIGGAEAESRRVDLVAEP